MNRHTKKECNLPPNLRESTAQMTDEDKFEILELKKDLINATEQISHLGMIIERM